MGGKSHGCHKGGVLERRKAQRLQVVRTRSAWHQHGLHALLLLVPYRGMQCTSEVLDGLITAVIVVKENRDLIPIGE